MAFNVQEFIAQKQSGASPVPSSDKFDVSKFISQKQSGVQEPPKIVLPSKLLKTQTGLETAAGVAGLESEVARVLSEKGEDPNRIFSGGFITDFFDVLNTIDYGVVGVLKGKSFAEGVKTRESFTKQDSLGKFGVGGFFGGLALDIAVDPLTYVGGAGIVTKLGKVPAIAKVVKKVAPVIDTVSKSKVAEFFGSRFVYRFGQDSIYRMMDERRIRNIGVGTQNLIDLARPITKLDSNVQKQIADARKAGQLENLSEELKKAAQPAFAELDKLGKEAVDVGLLSKDVYEKNVGTYMARLYRSKEAPNGAVEALKGLFPSKPLRIDLSRFKARQDIPEEVRQVMGEVMEAGYPTAKALVQLKGAVENAKFFKQVDSIFGKEAGEGMIQLPKTDRLGSLSGKSVPAPIADSINEIIRTKTPFQQVESKIVGGFKFSKVILNPATHARNIVSNLILNSWEGLNPLTPAGIKAYTVAAKELATAGPMYREAKNIGLGLDNFAANEIKGFLDAPEVAKLGEKVKGALDKAAQLYQKEEEFAKLSMYIFQRGKNLAPEQAWKIAERATFNYAQVTPFIRKLRESMFGFPFITFTYKATPQVVKTAFKTPTRISNIGKLKTAIENQSSPQELQREKASEPDWIRDGFYVKLPVKDKSGRSAYFDLTYILPFGDLVSGNYLESGISRETGLPETPTRSGLRKNPLLNLVAELAENKDFYGNKIMKTSDTTESQLKDIFRHVVQTYSPPVIAEQIPGGYRKDGTRRMGTFQRVANKEKGIEEGGTQTRTLMQELLKQVGLKVTPYDVVLQESFSESEKVKALQTLFKERGLISSFEIPFSQK